MTDRANVPSWQPTAEAFAVVLGIASGQLAITTAMPRWGPYGELALLRRAGGMDAAAVIGEPWTLLSNTWVHGDLEHQLGNLVFLLLMSVLLTRSLGWDRFLLLYLGSGLAGSLCAWAFERPDLMVGASGAVFGLTGATAVYAVWPRAVLHEAEVSAVREALLPIVGMQLLFSFAPGTAWGAHLGGFGFGAVVAGTGLLHLGLPERAEGLRMPPLRWGRAVVATIALIAVGCALPSATLALLVVYLGALVVTGMTAPSWRPRLYVPVMAAAIAGLAVNAAAVAHALRQGRPWELAPPLSVEQVTLPGGLGAAPLPVGLAAARTEDRAADGWVVVRYGDRDRFPFALWLAMADRADPDAIGALATRPVDGVARSWTGSRLDGPCPVLSWETRTQAGMAVVTGTHLVDVRLRRWGRPVSRVWAGAEDALVRGLLTLPACVPARLGPSETVALLEAVGLAQDALPALGARIAEAPDDPAPLLRRAAIFLELSRCDAALLDYDAATRRFPDQAAGWSGAARSRLRCSTSRDVAEVATQAASRAVTLAPDDLEAQVVLADALLASGRTDDAVAALHRALSLGPDAERRADLERQLAAAQRGIRVRRALGDEGP